ncbi:MAG: hypothetical protein IPH55_06570 [Betaproteobacteria bacterium]|nr:hypothetical protein [Betaproteobacteria bacterium]
MLIRNRVTLESEAQRTETKRRDKVAELEELERLIKDAPPIARWPGLDAALAAARALDLGPATIRAEQKLKLAEEKLTDLLARLHRGSVVRRHCASSSRPTRQKSSASRSSAPP